MIFLLLKMLSALINYGKSEIRRISIKYIYKLSENTQVIGPNFAEEMIINGK